MLQNQLVSLLVGSKAAEAQGLTGDALSRARMISLFVGNPVFSLLAIRSMAGGEGGSEPAKPEPGGVPDAIATATAVSTEAAHVAREAADEATVSAQAAARSAEEAKAAAAGPKKAN